MDEPLSVKHWLTESGAALALSRETPRDKLKHILLLLAKYAGLFAAARLITAQKTRILAYHGVWLGEGSFGNYLYMTSDKFAARMELLRKWGYPVVPLENPPRPGRCNTVITIDDGWFGTWSEMLPVLEAHGYPATVYLATYYCTNQKPVIDVALQYCFSSANSSDTRYVYLPRYKFGPICIDSTAARENALKTALELSSRLEGDAARQDFLRSLCVEIGIDYDRFTRERWFHLMNPSEVEDAASRGLSFESHTHHHRISIRGRDSLAEEIATNCAAIHSLVGRTPRHFCYPSGRYSPALWSTLQACDMVSATTTEPGLAGDTTPRYALPRILDGQNVSDLEFEAEMSGFMDLSRELRRTGRGRAE